MRKKKLQVVPASARDSRALIPCLECARCCTYVAVEINAPTTVRKASDILWFLYHDNVCVYRSEKGEWLIQFATRCKNLQAGNLCGIYEHRPYMCRDFDPAACEVNATDEGTHFYTPQDFLDYLKRTRKKIHHTLAAKYLPPHFAWNDAQTASPIMPEKIRRRSA